MSGETNSGSGTITFIESRNRGNHIRRASVPFTLHIPGGIFWALPIWEQASQRNHNLASLTVGECHRTYLRKMARREANFSHYRSLAGGAMMGGCETRRIRVRG